METRSRTSAYPRISLAAQAIPGVAAASQIMNVGCRNCSRRAVIQSVMMDPRAKASDRSRPNSIVELTRIQRFEQREIQRRLELEVDCAVDRLGERVMRGRRERERLVGPHVLANGDPEGENRERDDRRHDDQHRLSCRPAARTPLRHRPTARRTRSDRDAIPSRTGVAGSSSAMAQPVTQVPASRGPLRSRSC